jgi:hypothetical protein
MLTTFILGSVNADGQWMKRMQPFLTHWKKRIKSLYGKYPVEFLPLTSETELQARSFIHRFLTD